MRLLIHSLTLLALTAALPSHVLGQTVRWLPVFDSPKVDTAELEALAELGAELQATTGIELLDPVVAAAHFEEHFSVPAPHLSAATLDAAAEGLQEAVKQTAFDQWAQARMLGRPYWTMTQTQRDLVKAQKGVAQDAVDYCTMFAVGDFKAGRKREARASLRKCIEESPAVEPRMSGHAIMQLWDQLREQMLAFGPASLSIRTLPERSGCSATLNGQPIGDVPNTAENLVPGLVYRVQVTCQQPSRVHLVVPKPGGNTVTIDPRFDRDVISSGRMALSYPDPATRSRHRDPDARRLANYLDADAPVLVRPTNDDKLSLQVTVGQQTRSATLPSQPTSAQLQAVAHTLAGERPPRAEQPVVDLRDSPRQAAPSSALTWAGLGLTLGGALNIALSWRWYDLRSQYRSRLAESIYLSDYDETGLAALVLGAAGNGLAAAGVPLLLPEGTSSAFAWIGAAAGVAVATTGVVLAVNADPCGPTTCDPDGRDGMLGTLVLFHSVPLLTIPLTLGVRALTENADDVDFAVQASANGYGLSIQGSF
ncbi:MAG: hypothetical protein OXU20_07015 [Myxococcales bacterium]|nr:hypothetical protein [Myxococcales bacterium]MDD9965633.1 hypothetical protein [Myxococcales bacterium]